MLLGDQSNERRKLVTKCFKAMPRMKQHRSDEDQGIDQFLQQEYEHFLFNKAEATIEAYVRTIHLVMEWAAQPPGNGGRIYPWQLTKTVVAMYLVSLELEGFSLNHRAQVKSTNSFDRWLMEEKDYSSGTRPEESILLHSECWLLKPSEDQRYILRSSIEQEEDRLELSFCQVVD